MGVLSAGNIASTERRGLVFNKGQLVLLFFLFGLGSILISLTVKQAPVNSVFLLGFVSVGGLVLCRNIQVRLNDPALKILGYFWLIKLAITLFLLYAGWMPQLDPVSSSTWGYDPQRFYTQAQELIDNNWSTDFVSLNYVGILYYYGTIFYLIGCNPVIPALINAFVTLVATLYLLKVGYEIKGQRGPRDWTLSFALFLPEVLWYDIMTSRETLSAALLLFAMLTTGRYLARAASVSLSKLLIVVSLSMLAIAAVRTSMLLPVFASIALMVFLVKSQRGLRSAQRTILVVAIIALLIVGGGVTEYLGGYNFDIVKTLQRVTSTGVVSGMQWSDKSIGKLLLPEGLLQSILFVPPRMLLYLLAPLPNFFVSVNDLLAGSLSAWQRLFTLLSSAINVLLFPYALASLVQSIKTRKVYSAPLVFHISYWVTFMAIAGGNLIIHERYRVMAALLFFGCAWLGATSCSKRLVVKMSILWYSLLALGAIFYVVYKGL